MKIEIWSDYACPFCYIGEKRLERALAEVGDENISVEFKSFELDPEAGREVESSTSERFALKYGLSLTAAKERVEQFRSWAGTRALISATRRRATPILLTPFA